ncbi:uncharacterized protein K452DRAFT_323293 [Aplosporella prunicola CBS 121167]|uniref:Zn(2)-C6 fungal-type domain-containing protein n=1 Tax=Aplosporella prunicola CBS 121167 TaxID=1176127 RepID=A0A6A6BSW2_9PEZI|nr:uncharacterized protein K452DRAFT_323293 [Aplosporella prunicola CBS 121167]KAF2147070.1 hypothetical protein K452DRAFT_323293 [Aplosporella prunicola CBS 121167]
MENSMIVLPYGSQLDFETNSLSHAEPLQQIKPKASRTITNKTRTGCITCKKRHVKCDEAKPQCNNCLKSRGRCEGYSLEPRKKPSGPGQLCWDSRQLTRGTSPRMQLHVDPDALDFQNSSSMLYFQEFVGLVQGPWTSASSSGDLWEVTMPQITRNNDTLRHAAMAIGALSMWHRQSTYDSLQAVSIPALPTAERDAHYFHAVAYYCHSLKLQRQRASMPDAIILSVLLLFFETLRGNRTAALDHVNHGLALLFYLLTDDDADNYVANFAPNPRPILGAVADIFTNLTMQGRTIFRGRVGHDMPLPNLTKGLKNRKQTIESFMVLLSQLPRSRSIDRIPDVFNDLDEFEAYWLAARRRQTLIYPIMVEVMKATGFQRAAWGSSDGSVINKFFLHLLDNQQVTEFCEASGKLIQALDTAFMPLFNKIIMSDPKSPTYLRAIHLRMQYLGVMIDDPPQYVHVESVHARTPLFREYLSLAEIALHTAKREVKNPAHQLSLQCGLSWYFLIIALFCRDPMVRDQAIWMLKDYPGQDGLWSARSLYLLALRNRSVEQMNTLEGSPLEQWQRLWRREFVFEDGGDRIVFRYLGKNEITGVWELVEEAADVQRTSEDVQWKRQPLIGSGGPLMIDLYALLQ